MNGTIPVASARVVAAVSVIVLAGCGTASTPGASPTPGASSAGPVTTTPDASPTTSSPPGSPAATGGGSTQPSALPSAGPAGRIDGTAESVDDVGDADRVPLEDGTLAVLPAADAGRLWEAIEFTPDAAQLSTVGGLVDADVLGVDRLVAIEAGRFGLDVDDGDYLVCLLDGTGPYAVRGCSEATVAGPASWRVSIGEGGFSLSTG